MATPSRETTGANDAEEHDRASSLDPSDVTGQEAAKSASIRKRKRQIQSNHAGSDDDSDSDVEFLYSWTINKGKKSKEATLDTGRSVQQKDEAKSTTSSDETRSAGCNLTDREHRETAGEIYELIKPFLPVPLVEPAQSPDASKSGPALMPAARQPQAVPKRQVEIINLLSSSPPGA